MGLIEFFSMFEYFFVEKKLCTYLSIVPIPIVLFLTVHGSEEKWKLYWKWFWKIFLDFFNVINVHWFGWEEKREDQIINFAVPLTRVAVYGTLI